MRIRKNNSAKISSLLNATNLKPPAGPVINHQSIIISHVVTTNCELNQSPWDVITTFSPPSSPPPPPPPPQVNKTDVEYNNSSMDTISTLDRDDVRDYHVKAAEEEGPGPVSSVLVICCKTDGKSRQCRKKAVPGSLMCQHHLSQTRSYIKKLAEVAQRRRPPRPKKTSGSSTSSNPYEFYYYSGFGPRWGKKRGGVGDADTTTNGCELAKNVEHDHLEMELKSEMPELLVEDDHHFNYVEYEDEDDHEEKETMNGKKRARKPIKARSLKSLM